MLKPYENYKPSGIVWIGDVPDEWDAERLKFLAKVNPTKGNSKFEKDSNQYCVFLPMENVSENGTFSNESKQKIADVWSGYTYFERGDIVVAKITPCFENGKGAYLKNLETEIGFGTTEFHVLRPNKAKILPELLFLITRTNMFMKMGESLMRGSAGQQRVSTDFVENFLVWFPKSLPEQQAIVRFLDYKTEQIETFIQNRQAQIRLLREQRQALINRAVTRGIRPNVATKPSGVEWIGEIPAHWEIKRLKFLTEQITNGFVGPTRDILRGSGVKYIQALHVKQNSIIFNEPYYVSEEWSLQHPRSILQAGDLVITQTGAYTGDVGIIPEEFEGSNCHALIILKPDRTKVIPQYLLYVLSSHFGQSLLYSIRTGSMHPHLNSTIVCDIFLPYVSDLSEQQAIIDYIQTETGRLDELMGKYRKQIGYMTEYKTALISQAVTGKIDVRNWQPPATRPTLRTRSNFTENVLVEEETP